MFNRTFLRAEHIVVRTTTLSIFAIAVGLVSRFLSFFFSSFLSSRRSKHYRFAHQRLAISRVDPRADPCDPGVAPVLIVGLIGLPTVWSDEIITNPTQLARPTQPCASSGLRGLPRVVLPSLLQEGRNP